MSNEVYDFNIGHSTAYAYAKASGDLPEGMTPEEYGELLASYATVGQTAVTAAQTATTKASEAATSATTATNKATEATTAAQTATTKAAEAQADADAAALDASQALSAASTATTKATEATTAAATATSAKTDAVAANTAAQSAKTAAQTAQTGAETAAASVSASAEQIATNASDISQLKSDINEPYNKLDGTKLTKNKRVNGYGEIVDANNYYLSDYVKVTPQNYYVLSYAENLIFFDVSKTQLSGMIGFGVSHRLDPDVPNVYKFQAPQNCCYVRYSYSTSSKNIYFIDYTDSLDASNIPYEPYVATTRMETPLIDIRKKETHFNYDGGEIVEIVENTIGEVVTATITKSNGVVVSVEESNGKYKKVTTIERTNGRLSSIVENTEVL